MPEARIKLRPGALPPQFLRSRVFPMSDPPPLSPPPEAPDPSGAPPEIPAGGPEETPPIEPIPDDDESGRPHD